MADGDYNGDGNPDLAAANQLANTVSVILNATLHYNPHEGRFYH